MKEVNVTPILEEVVDWRFKGFPASVHPVTIGNIGRQHWNIFKGDLMFPIMLLKERALKHNIDLMAAYCSRNGITLAPHGKTPMSPQIAKLQLDAGAWGISVANIFQARVFHSHGMNRILLANELLDTAGIEWVSTELGRDPDFEFFCLIDSLTGVSILNDALQRLRTTRPFQILLEMGVPTGRTGCRTIEEACAVAKAIDAAPHLQLAGVEGYEGAVAAETIEERIAAVDRFLPRIRDLTMELYAADLFTGREEIIVSAGGSLFFDRVVEILAAPWDLPVSVRIVVRSGSYMAHDRDTYQTTSPLADRGEELDRLEPALELWGTILSRPEPELAIANFGKRDAPYDLRLPMPFALRRGDGTREVGGQVEVTALNDQHAYLWVDPELDVAPGDLIGCDISHPCTTFDKWQLMPLVDDHYNVTGAIRTFF